MTSTTTDASFGNKKSCNFMLLILGLSQLSKVAADQGCSLYSPRYYQQFFLNGVLLCCAERQLFAVLIV